jgi:hypothetical protein
MLFMTGVHGNTSRFDRVALGAILTNTVVLGWSWLDRAHAVTLERVDTCFVVFFLIELVTRLRRAGWRWLSRPWNLFDATIILLALLPVVGDGITILRMARVAKLVHLGRHISHLRLAPWLPLPDVLPKRTRLALRLHAKGGCGVDDRPEVVTAVAGLPVGAAAGCVW